MKYHLLFSSTLILLSSVLTANATDNKSLKYTINDRSIVFPFSSDPNNVKIDDNWYLNNFAILDTEGQDYRDATDSELRKRLEELSKHTGIDMPFNPLVKNYIERYFSNKNRNLVPQMLGLNHFYMPIFEKALSENGVAPKHIEAIKYLPVTGSELNPSASSLVGASGLWQLMVITAKGHGLEVNTLVDERRDPVKSSYSAAIFLKRLYDRYNDWLLAIAASYNGMGNVNKAIRRAQKQGIEKPDFWSIYNFLPKATRGYVPAFIATCYAMNYYQAHGINPTLARKPLVLDSVKVNDRVSFHQISQVLNIPLEEIRLLNPQYRTDVIPGNIKPYNLVLPKQQIESYSMAREKILKYHRNQFARRDEVQPGDVKNIVGEEKDEIPDDGTIYHTVIEGEDLQDIASRYGMSLNELLASNNIRYEDEVEDGDVLKIKRKGSNLVNSTVNSGSSYSSSSNSSGNYAYNDNKSSSSNSNRYVDDDDDDYSEEVYQQELKRQQEEAARKKRDAEAKKKRDAEAKKKREAELAAQRKRDAEIAEAKRRDAEAKKKREEEERRRREAEKPINHKVTEGQNLTKLAQQYGTTPEAIMQASNITDPNIKIGQVLKIPRNGQQYASQQQPKQGNTPSNAGKKTEVPYRATNHKVAVGDNLTKLAQQYGTTPEAIMQANNLTNDNIQIGQTIKIPNGSKVAQQQGKQQGNVASNTGNKKRNEVQSTTFHKVTEGQNLTKLAQQYGTTPEVLMQLNNLSDDNIKIGQNLKVPGNAGKPQQAAKQHNVADNDNDKKRNADEKAAAKKKRDADAKKKHEAELAEKKKKEAAEAKKKREEEERRRREAAKPIVHEVKEGQNLTKLAQQYGTTPEAIRKANNIKGDNIVIGQKINIPKGGKNAHAQQHDNDEQHHQHKSSKNTKQVVKNNNNSTVQPSNGRKRRK